MENISVKDFVDSYCKFHDKSYIRKFIKTDYLKYEEKVALCSRVIESTCYTMVDNEKVFFLNSPSRYMVYCMDIIRTYTNITIDFNNILDEFNMLDKNRLIDEIFELIPSDEIKKLDTILKMELDDLYENERSIRSLIDMQSKKINMSFDFLIKSISEIVSDEKLMNTIKKQFSIK